MRSSCRGFSSFSGGGEDIEGRGSKEGAMIAGFVGGGSANVGLRM